MDEFTKQDLETIYSGAWEIGAINLLGLANSLPKYIEKARKTEYKDKHPAIQLLLAHMSFLAGNSLGPEEETAKKVKAMIDGTLSECYVGVEFRELNNAEQEAFREWARENQTPEHFAKKGLYSPEVRNEWERIGYKGT